jgi:hypothetical protein
MRNRRNSVFLCLLVFVSTFFLQAQQSCRPVPPTSPTNTPLSIMTIEPTQTAVSTATASATASATALATASATASTTPQVLPDSGLESLAKISYLGEGVGPYNIPEGFYFLVKRIRPFRFDYESGPHYSAKPDERVWRVQGNSPIKVYDQEVQFQEVWVGCRVRYLQIDDDSDTRRNNWYIDGKFVHLMPQGMVVEGSFDVPFEGMLTLLAEDSIGADIDVDCPRRGNTKTPTPLPPTPTATVPDATATVVINTPDPTGLTATPFSPSATPSPTVMGTAVPATNTPIPTPTVPQGPAYTRFNFEMAGHVGKNGRCYMKRDTGDELLVWDMQDGWTDSAAHPLADADGWIEVYIPHPSIYVEVYCDAGDGLVRMNIHNGVQHPHNGRIVGWLTRGMHNAIEIGWP